MEKSSSYCKIRENAKKLLKNNFKYYIGLVSGTKKKMLASSDSKSGVEKDAKEKLIELFDGKLEKLDGFDIYKLNIRKTSKKEIKEDKETKYFSLVGGILVITIQDIKINIINNKIKLTSYDEGKIEDFVLSEKIFLDNKFLTNNNKISKKDLLKLLFFRLNSYWTAVSVVKASKYI